MKKVYFLLFFSIFHLRITVSDKRLGCYFENDALDRRDPGRFEPKDINATLCTHVIFGFAIIRGTEVIERNSRVDKRLYKETMDLKKQNSNLKVLLAIRQDYDDKKEFRIIADNDEKRKEFIKNCLNYVRKFKFDGIELHWIDPEEKDKTLLTRLLKDLKEALSPHSLILTTIISENPGKLEYCYEIAELLKYCEFLNVFAYDYYAHWSKKTGFNSPLFRAKNDTDLGNNIYWALNYLHEQNGVDMQKINLVLGTFGRSFSLVSSYNTTVGSKAFKDKGMKGEFTDEIGLLSLYEICKIVTSKWKKILDSDQLCPYAYSGSDWISYENRDSLKSKIELMKYFSVGGVSFYTLNYDDFKGEFCKRGSYPFINFVKNEFQKDAELNRTIDSENIDELRKALKPKCKFENRKVKLNLKKFNKKLSIF